MPDIPVRATQSEGFAYLGLGVLGLLAVRVAWSARAPRSMANALHRHWPLVLAVLVMWLYALSVRVSYRGETLIWFGNFYAPLKPLTGVFRSSGRFAWPIYIALVALAVSAAARFKDVRLGRAVLLAAVVLQASELKASRLNFQGAALRPLKHAAWAKSATSYEHLALVPLHLLWTCRYDHKLVDRLSYEAYRRRWTFNSGNFGRKPVDAAKLCNAPITLDPRTVYVADKGRPPRALTKAGYECGRLDGLVACVASDPSTPLLAALRKHPVR